MADDDLGSAYLVGAFFSHPPPGITTVLLLLLINLGVMSLGIGILGEYIGKVFSPRVSAGPCGWSITH